MNSPLADEVVVVSGLPRSGTSMLMQMLAAGGLPLLVDDRRSADEDNPRGYFEYEPVKRLSQGNDWIHTARGKGVKIVAPLLRYVPLDERYRIILIDRDLDEVLASQQQMIERRGAATPESALGRARLRDEFARQLAALRFRLIDWHGASVVRLDYAAAVQHPHATAEQVDAFLGGQLDVHAMAAAVDRELHRHRGV